MNELFSVNGKVAVVTGGSLGIGAMIARGFVENGVKTYITARKAEPLEAMDDELSQLGECIAIQSDLSSTEGVEAFSAAIREREERLHILVNNAGATWGADFGEFPEAGWDKVMDLNVKSLFFLTQEFLPQLEAAASQDDPARVVNISSINGITHPGMNNYSYSASKAAVIQLTRHLAADLGPRHINVNGIAPGFFPSKMTKHLLPMEQEMAQAIPVRRLGQAEDAAGVTIFLCSRAANYVCGHTVAMDGGMIAAAG